MQKFLTAVPNQFNLPERIERLGELAYNLWWTWDYDVQRLYSRIDKQLWEQVLHNPIIFLRQVDHGRLESIAHDRYYLEFYDRMFRSFDRYMRNGETWFGRHYPGLKDQLLAYFSMEFGLHETLPLYAGGLGVLSGDHTKEASDMGLPFVGVGLFYTEGYFDQRITEDGWQEANYHHRKFEDMPAVLVEDNDGAPLTITIQLAGREVFVRIWELRVGRVPLYLLDTDFDSNSTADRSLTSRLYSSDIDLKISQQIILGIGGVRALRIMGYEPLVWHMNEGHAAFLVLERMREYIIQGHSIEEATEKVCEGNVFTTHTPVPAGNDEFALWLMDKYFYNYWPELGLSRDEFINLARNTVDWGEAFSMPVLALKFSNGRNGVSELHGEVARKMWNFVWPEYSVDEVPITYITNGIHTGTWLARRLRLLFDRYLGANWIENVDNPDMWDLIYDIPDEQLWAVRRHLKRKMVLYIRDLARARWIKGDWSPVQVVASGSLLDPYALTIGFARRFAPYKRANLILSDMERLLDIIHRVDTPVQIIFAGKSHPDNEAGKLLIQEVYRAVKRNDSGGHLVFLEEYDMNLARYLTQGVDVWLNTPLRPNEASGTSGQKAALNGVLNFSVLDGWWREGFDDHNGWAIGQDIESTDPHEQDKLDAQDLYDTLEYEIIPLYYNLRSSDNLPGDWIARMKDSIRTLAPQFSTRRMVREYVEELYLSAMKLDK